MDIFDIVATVLVIALLLFMFVGGIVVCISEHKEYNKGYCSCGGRWKSFDMASDCSIGWNCTNCGRYMWTSYVNPRRYENGNSQVRNR
ncbi:putative membrane protein [Bacillus phage SP-15]|uniref:Putative membrane protein n=1 Tax=Bacillus phage SP-15 TaxID=1792032 RepID=A0A127AWT7_9CAUD|nr:hypothetical protein SP15_251 [Bacillus phage SP-15]AMM45057.1 putative membrane protein [Bacillus phage SP-15]